MNKPPHISLLGIPWDENSSFMRGSAGAPALIRETLYSDSTNLWTESGFDLGDTGIFDNLGDLPLSEPVDPHLITGAICELARKPTVPLCLGGDHAVSYPIVRGIHRVHGPVDLLQFDAHPDLWECFNENRFSNACPFARIMEENLAERLVQIGIRTANAHQRRQAARFHVEMIEMNGLSSCQSRLEFTLPLYISFDIDVLDPAFAPGVSHPEPGGLSTREAVNLIRSVKAPSIAGIDVVEYNPVRDSREITAYAAVKIIKELSAQVLALKGIDPPSMLEMGE